MDKLKGKSEIEVMHIGTEIIAAGIFAMKTLLMVNSGIQSVVIIYGLQPAHINIIEIMTGSVSVKKYRS